MKATVWIILIILTIYNINLTSAQPLIQAASSSSQAIPELAAGNAIDGNPATFWSSGVHGNPNSSEWLRIDLSRNVRLKGLSLTPRTGFYGFPVSYSVEYSMDENGTFWFAVPGAVVENEPVPTGIKQLNFPGVVIARRLRITASTLSADDFGNYYFQLAEIGVIEDSKDMVFQTDYPGDFEAQLNSFWNVYGELADGSNATFDFGNEPAWYEWLGIKYMWSETTLSKQQTFRNKLIYWPMCPEGYMWSWLTQHEWPTGTFSRHEENNAKYILGCWRYWTWTRDDSFFNQLDNNTETSPSAPDSCQDVSAGKTVKQKLRKAMEYLEVQLHGTDGGIVIEDYGPTTGKTDGDPTNYWDNYRFGHQNGYDNIYYYAAVKAMAEMERYWGDTARADILENRRAGIQASYNQTFWNSQKGRYIACIDIDGVKWDFGFTFQNTEAAAYGLPTPASGELIYSWLDGTRIITTDFSKGSDIYFWKWAPRANTIKAESIGPPYWWEDLGGAIRVDNAGASYGNHLENGGAILYNSYYDIVGRKTYSGITSAHNRLAAIVDEYRKDQLRRDPANSAGAAWVIGIIGEFPESGLVPAVVPTLYMGMEADSEGLHLSESMVSGMTSLKVNGITYAGCVLDITCEKNRLIIKSRFASTRTLFLGQRAIMKGFQIEESMNPGWKALISLSPVDVKDSSMRIY